MQIKPATRLLLWLVVAMAVFATLTVQLSRGIVIDTNILGLLPKTERDPIVQSALDTFSSNFSRKMTFLVGADNKQQAIVSATRVVETLQQSKLFTEINFFFDKDSASKTFKHYFPYRAGLLSATDRVLLQQGNIEQLKQRSLATLYNPASPISSSLLKDDPLLLFFNFLTSTQPSASQLQLVDNVLLAEYNQQSFIFISAELSQSPFSLPLQQQLKQLLKSLENNISTSTLITAGMPLHAMAGTASAKHEISVIGGGSIAAIILLILLVFRSTKPLLIALLPIAFGVAAAITACALLFDSIHMLSLVFGACLVGVSIDYSFHYFCEHLGSGNSWQAELGLQRIFTGISFGLGTSIIGYLALFIAPFPGLHQMAVFSSVGLFAAYLTVVCVFPSLLTRPYHYQPQWAWRITDKLFKPWDAIVNNNRLAMIILPLLILMGAAISTVQTDDDIRLLRNTPDNIAAMEKQFSTITGQQMASEFFLVSGTSAEQVLQTEELLLAKLGDILPTSSVRAISQSLPSLQRQHQQRQWLAEHLKADAPLAQHLTQLGFSKQTINNYRQQTHGSGLTFTDWSVSPMAKLYQNQWLTTKQGEFASIVMLNGRQHTSALTTLADSIDGVSLIDQVSDVSTLFKRYRQRAVHAVLAAYGIIFLLLVARYRFKFASLIMLPPVLAAGFALAVSAAFGQAINLFNIVALLLVLAIGIDYTLFFAESDSQHRRNTALAILLSCITTLLAFGLLALSSTPAIQSFGITVGSGIIFAFLGSPLASAIRTKSTTPHRKQHNNE